MEAYNEEGKMIEGVLSAEEVNAKIEERLAEMTEKGLVLNDEQKAEMDKLKDKDFNFEALRKKNEGNKDVDDEEKTELKATKEDLEARLKAIEESTKSKSEKEALSWEEKAFSRVNPSNDEKMTEKIKFIIENKLSGVSPQTEQEYLELVVDASRLLPQDEFNPILSANSVSGSPSNAKIRPSDTQEGEEFARKQGFSYINDEKYGK